MLPRGARAGPHAAELIAEAQGLHNEAGPHFAGKEVRVLVDVTGTMMNTEAVQALKASTKRDSSMVEKPPSSASPA